MRLDLRISVRFGLVEVMKKLHTVYDELHAEVKSKPKTAACTMRRRKVLRF